MSASTMSTLSTAVGGNLPFLRRYARALTGSQTSGDSYVAALMEALISNPSALQNAPSGIRVELYKMLSKVWGSIQINKKVDAHTPAWEATAQERLAAIPPIKRQIFLLLAVEGFTHDEVAQILSMPVSEVREGQSEVSQQISEMLESRIMIIEDEPLIVMDLEDIVTSLGHTSVGAARTHAEAVKMAQQTKPDLVLSDIQLADGSSGIDAVVDILRNYQVPVIFITAFPERLLTGTRPEPTFLITKPFSPDMVKALIAQALFFGASSHASA